MRWVLAFVLIAFAPPALAQVQSRPTDPPMVTAEGDSWFRRGEPVQFAGHNYRQAGAAVFFDGNRMVRSGSFNGVPIYTDTTLEPYSVVFVPIGRGLMQPYERPRSGELAGTTGSYAPAFPVSAVPDSWIPPMAASAPTALGPIPVLGDALAPAGVVEDRVLRTLSQAPAAELPAIATAPPPPPLTPADIQKARERIWVEYQGDRWIPAGPAIPVANSGLLQTGSYAGFPVYAFAQQTDRIFLPSLGGLAAPYQRKR